jgi:hypothetical protein
MYAPKFPPPSNDLPGLTEYVRTEFDAVANAQSDARDYLQLSVQHKAPARPRAGMLAEADGTDWNPGSGAGLYMYRSSAWVLIG